MASQHQITNRQRPRGFTLLEVIVAMTLLAIGITGVLGAISVCLRSTETAESYSRAALYAQQVAVLLEHNATLTNGNQSGTFVDQSTGPDDSQFPDTANMLNGYSWTAVISAADSQGCCPVQITVTWQSGKRQYQLNTILLPQQLPPAQPATPATGGGTSGPSGGTPPFGGGMSS